jgi:hypothetical protein
LDRLSKRHLRIFPARGGSPQAQRIVIQQTLLRQLERFKQDAKIMAGIEEE